MISEYNVCTPKLLKVNTLNLLMKTKQQPPLLKAFKYTIKVCWQSCESNLSSDSLVACGFSVHKRLFLFVKESLTHGAMKDHTYSWIKCVINISQLCDITWSHFKMWLTLLIYEPYVNFYTKRHQEVQNWSLVITRIMHFLQWQVNVLHCMQAVSFIGL